MQVCGLRRVATDGAGDQPEGQVERLDDAIRDDVVIDRRASMVGIDALVELEYEIGLKDL